MKPRVLGRLLMTALMAGAGIAAAATANGAGPQSDADIAKQVRHEIVMYPSYSIWDDVSFRVSNGQVELSGAVSQPFKKFDIQRLVQRVPGVAGVTNEVRVLPLSPNDDRLRLQVARAIFRDPSFTRYAMAAVPSIHIIVENGHVTLTGVVGTDMEKQIAGMRANTAGLSFGPVVNNLQVEHPSKRG
jgi:hyperosmotically inducible periplasmic protein